MIGSFREQGEVPSRNGLFSGPLEGATFARYTVPFASCEVDLLVLNYVHYDPFRLTEFSDFDDEHSNSTHHYTALTNHLK